MRPQNWWLAVRPDTRYLDEAGVHWVWRRVDLETAARLFPMPDRLVIVRATKPLALAVFCGFVPFDRPDEVFEEDRACISRFRAL